MTASNPFTLTFGRKPENFISRHEITASIIDTFCNSSLSQTYLIEGVRGSGKTVLMTSIASELKEDSGWVVVNLNPSLDLLDNLAKRLHDECRTIPNLLGKGFNISVAGVGLGIDVDDQLRDNVSIIKGILDALKKKKKKVLITIDEVANDDNMRTFASQFQIFLREDYPLYLIMTGLAENIFEIQNDPALTFLLRSPKVEMEPLSKLQITRKYSELLGVDEEKARKLACLTKGYAFAYQALGAVYWPERENPNMEDIVGKLDEMLDDYVYKKIWSSLTAKEREIILAIKHDDTKTGEICEVTGIKPNSFSQYKSKLTRMGLITSSGYGYNSLTLPRFYEIVRLY